MIDSPTVQPGITGTVHRSDAILTCTVHQRVFEPLRMQRTMPVAFDATYPAPDVLQGNAETLRGEPNVLVTNETSLEDEAYWVMIPQYHPRAIELRHLSRCKPLRGSAWPASMARGDALVGSPALAGVGPMATKRPEATVAYTEHIRDRCALYYALAWQI